MPDRAFPLVLAGNDHRYAGRLRDGGADRTEQHPGESASAMATDDDELGPLGLVEQMASRLLKLDQSVDRDLGIAFLPAGETFGESFLGRGLHDRRFDADDGGHVRVAPDVQRHQIHTSP